MSLFSACVCIRNSLFVCVEFVVQIEMNAKSQITNQRHNKQNKVTRTSQTNDRNDKVIKCNPG